MCRRVPEANPCEKNPTGVIARAVHRLDSRRNWGGPENLPEITAEWIATAALPDGKRLERRGCPVA